MKCTGYKILFKTTDITITGLYIINCFINSGTWHVVIAGLEGKEFAGIDSNHDFLQERGAIVS